MTLASARYVLFWDIDGTLLTTARAGVPALEDAAEAVTGRRPDLSRTATSGLTDRMIARLVLSGLGCPGDADAESRFLQVYAEALPGRLEQRRGRVLPGVLDALTALGQRGDTANVLLTGNLRAGAEAKLRSYDLWHHFSTGGYAEDGHERPDIARAAIRRARALHGAAADSGVLIGDTPYDIRAGAAVGMPVVAVASPAHSRNQLAALEPWWAVDAVPPAEDLLARMDAVSATASS